MTAPDFGVPGYALSSEPHGEMSIEHFREAEHA